MADFKVTAPGQRGTPRLIVTIDTECDKQSDWRYRNPLSFEGIEVGIARRLQPLFSDFGVRPVYFLSPEVLCDPGSCALLRGLEGVELAAHLHGNFILPEIETWDFPSSVAKDMQFEYGSGLERAKMAVLTELFAQQIGLRPVSFRAGRFGIGPDTGQILSDLGYRVDSSVTPHIAWTDNSGRRFPDFRGALESPYWTAQNGSLWHAGTGDLLEVPVTILPAGTVRANKSQDPIWFRPWYSDAETLGRVLRHVAAQPPHDGFRRPLVMMFHNIEVIAGASPYPQTETDVSRYLDMLKRTFELAEQLGVEACTLAEYYDAVRSSKAPGSQLRSASVGA